MPRFPWRWQGCSGPRRPEGCSVRTFFCAGPVAGSSSATPMPASPSSPSATHPAWTRWQLCQNTFKLTLLWIGWEWNKPKRTGPWWLLPRGWCGPPDRSHQWRNEDRSYREKEWEMEASTWIWERNDDQVVDNPMNLLQRKSQWMLNKWRRKLGLR